MMNLRRMPQGVAVHNFNGRIQRLQALQRDVSSRLAVAESFVDEVKSTHMLVSSMLLLSKNIDWSKWDETWPDVLISCKERNLCSRTEGASTCNSSATLAMDTARECHTCTGTGKSKTSRLSSSSCQGDCAACQPCDGITDNCCNSEHEMTVNEDMERMAEAPGSIVQNCHTCGCPTRLSDGDSGIDATTLNHMHTEDSKACTCSCQTTAAAQPAPEVAVVGSSGDSEMQNEVAERRRLLMKNSIGSPVKTSLTEIILDLQQLTTENTSCSYWPTAEQPTLVEPKATVQVKPIAFIRTQQRSRTFDSLTVRAIPPHVAAEEPRRHSSTAIASVFVKLSSMFAKKKRQRGER